MDSVIIFVLIIGLVLFIAVRSAAEQDHKDSTEVARVQQQERIMKDILVRIGSKYLSESDIVGIVNKSGLDPDYGQRLRDHLRQKNHIRNIPTTPPAKETIYLVEAQNGMQVRVPESKLDSWLTAQEENSSGISEATKNIIKRRMIERIYGPSTSKAPTDQPDTSAHNVWHFLCFLTQLYIKRYVPNYSPTQTAYLWTVLFYSVAKELRKQKLVDEIYSYFNNDTCFSSSQPLSRQQVTEMQAAYHELRPILNASCIDPHTDDGFEQLWRIVKRWVHNNMDCPNNPRELLHSFVVISMHHAHDSMAPSECTEKYSLDDDVLPAP